MMCWQLEALEDSRLWGTDFLFCVPYSNSLLLLRDKLKPKSDDFGDCKLDFT